MDGWQAYVQAPHSAFQKPVRIVRVTGHVAHAQALVSGAGTTTLTYRRGGPRPVIVLDFGHETGGFPSFKVSRFAGRPVLRSSYSETRAGLDPDGDYAGKRRRVRVQQHPVRRGGRLRSARIEGGLRYERLTLSAPGSVSLSSAGIVYSAFRGTPRALRGHFYSSDRLLNRIWYAGVYTVNLNQVVPGLRPQPGQRATEPVLIDGAKRDRRIWAGDLLTAARSAYYSVSPRYVRGSLEVLGRHPVAPLAGVCSPNTRGGDGCRFYSATYSMAFVLALHDYYRYTGDLAFVRRQWPAVARQLAWCARRVDRHGLLSVNHRTGRNWNLESFAGKLTYVNSVYVEALNDAAELSDALQMGRAERFRSRAATTTRAVNDRLWSAARGVYNISTTRHGPVAQDANVFAVLSHIASPARAALVMHALNRKLLTHYGALNVSRPFPAAFRPIISPYMGGFQLQADFETGRTASALALIRREWGLMVSHDPGGTVWEKIQTNGRLTPYASAAHAWSAGATSALSEFVLGAAPDAPGWTTWKVQPHPGDVTWASGGVPTGHGALGVGWVQGPHRSEFALSVSAPPGTQGSVWIPLLGSTRVITRDGAVVWDGVSGTSDAIPAQARDGYVVLPQQSGAHTYAWS